VYSDSCCTYCLACMRGGIFWLTYIRRSDVSVSVRIGALQYVGKDYLVDGLFKVNIAVVDKKSAYLYPKLINKEKSFVYLLESPILW